MNQEENALHESDKPSPIRTGPNTPEKLKLHAVPEFDWFPLPGLAVEHSRIENAWCVWFTK